MQNCYEKIGWQLDFFEQHNYLRKSSYLIEIKLFSSRPGVSIDHQLQKVTQSFSENIRQHFQQSQKEFFLKIKDFFASGVGRGGSVRECTVCSFPHLFPSHYNKSCEQNEFISIFTQISLYLCTKKVSKYSAICNNMLEYACILIYFQAIFANNYAKFNNRISRKTKRII